MRPLKSGSNGSISMSGHGSLILAEKAMPVVVQNNKSSSQINFRILGQ